MQSAECEIGHQRTAARFGLLRPAKQFKSTTTADAQILRLDGGNGKDIRQIKYANESGFAVGDFTPGFRGNDLRARPRWKAEVTGDG
jgi:ubiquitin